MIYLTGDTHGDFRRFSTKRFPVQKQLSRDDYVIILGDFGGVWDGSPRETHELDLLASRTPTFLFLDGNHDNFDLLNQYPYKPFQGGMVHEIRPNVLHLCRGHVFDLDGRPFFVMGGAQSHDAKVLLNPAQNSSETRRMLRRREIPFRVEGESWWRQELPSYFELRLALDNLLWVEHPERLTILTHCAPTGLQQRLFPDYPVNALTDYLHTVQQRLPYHRWFCGHYHQEITLSPERFSVLYESVIPYP